LSSGIFFYFELNPIQPLSKEIGNLLKEPVNSYPEKSSVPRNRSVVSLNPTRFVQIPIVKKEKTNVSESRPNILFPSVFNMPVCFSLKLPPITLDACEINS